MVVVLICSAQPLDAELSRTLLWRREFDRHQATRADEARVMVAALKPSLLLVERDLPGALALVTRLREDPATRRTSIAVAARGDLEPHEVELLEAGANAILRLPPGSDWNERLLRLVNVPVRREVRFLVTFKVQAASTLGGLPIDATGRNLSLTGMLLDSPADLDLHTELRVQLRLSSLEAPLEVTGRLVRQAGPTVYGVEFVDFAGDGREKLRRFLDTLKNR